MKKLSLVCLSLVLATLALMPAMPMHAQNPLLPTMVETTAVSAGVTDTTATDMLAAPGAGLRWYITKAQCINVSASTQSAAIIKTSTTSIWMVGCAPGSTANGMIKFDPPLQQTTLNTKLTMTATAGATTNYFLLAGFKGR